MDDQLATDDPRADAQPLLTELSRLCEGIEARAAERMQGWAGLIRDPAFEPAAQNLARYLALRDADLTDLQPRLSALGLSSLGRAEGHVAASLDAVRAALAAIAGVPGKAFPAASSLAAANAERERRRDQLFGAGAGDPPAGTRIMVTLPTEAADDPALVAELARAGADCIRINAAHDDEASWQRMVDHAAAAGEAAGRKLRVQFDLGGPKLRTAAVAPKKPERMKAGDRFELVPSLADDPDLPQATLTQPQMLAAMQPGAEVWIDDGKLRAVVEKLRGGGALLRVTGARGKGVRLKPEKGVSLRGVDLDIPALTADDLAVLPFVARNADLVALSFVQTTDDVAAILDALEAEAGEGGDRPALILKIETPQAVRNLPDLIVAAGGRGPVGVMIARGDLAVEIGFERLSEIQEEMLWICEAARVPAIWATQVLEGLVKEGQASRAETTDAAMAQRAECVMLNKGPHLADAVRFLRDVFARMDRHAAKRTGRMGRLGSWRAGG